MRTSPFWFLTIGTALRVIVLTAVTVHYIPILVWKGLSLTEAAFLLGVQAFLGIPITLSFGWLADRHVHFQSPSAWRGRRLEPTRAALLVTPPFESPFYMTLSDSK